MGEQRPRPLSDPSAETATVNLPERPGTRGATAEPGGPLGRYVLLEVIGQGGMGRVMRAYDPKLQREVALKLVHRSGLDQAVHDRMLREARAMALLSPPNVVAVHDAEESSAGLVLVMEYVAGLTLRQWLGQEPRPWLQVVDHFRRAGQGLAAAHAQELLHRDFKPSNVRLSDAGEVKVTDFGLAKLASATGRPLSQQVQDAPRPGDPLDGELTHHDATAWTSRCWRRPS